MAGPVLTPDEIAQMQKEAAKAQAAAATFTAQIAAQQARAVELAKVDSAFKKFFDYYNNDIIAHYDSEKKAINGQFITSPITEADIQASGSLSGGRIQPSLPATDVIRIPEFDGGGLSVTPDANNELQFITDQATQENVLVNGYGGTAPSLTTVTATAVTAASTTLQLTNPAATYSITPGTVLIVSSISDFAVVRIDTFVMQVTPVPPPYIANCGITVLVPPTGSIPSGQPLKAFTGFTNSERTSKTTTDPQLQGLMDYLVLQLQNKINGRISTLNAQLAAIALNQDPDGVAALTQATTDVNASKTFLTNYLVSTNISNSGLGTLSTERGSRTTQANARVAAITAAYTGQSKNYYNERYNSANNRGNTSRGSLRLQKAAEQAGAASAGFAATLTDQANAIGIILP